MKPNGIHWKHIFSLKSMMYTVLGVCFAVVALKGFMIPNHFLDGGVTGISILLTETFFHHHMEYISLILVVLNIPFVIMGYYKIGKTFAVQSAIAVILLAVLMLVLEVPTVTDDKILIAVFGGFLIGMGIGLVIRGGGVIDGFEIVAHYTNMRIGFTTGEIVMLTNTIIFLSVAYSFGIEAAMYSILTYFTAIKTSDYVVDGFEEFTALTVVSKKHDEVKSLIVNDFHKAISVYKGERGYLPSSYDVKHDVDIVMTIVTRLEIHRLRQAILSIDPEAFVYVHGIKEVKGGVGKQTERH